VYKLSPEAAEALACHLNSEGQEKRRGEPSQFQVIFNQSIAL